jgi:predicted XRE-type DNA-binding protein
MAKGKKKQLKRKPGRPSAEQAEAKTELQLKRWAAMAAARQGRGITQQALKDELNADGVEISQSTIGAVLRDKFDHPEMQDMFCIMTGTSFDEMWPGTAAERREAAALATHQAQQRSLTPQERGAQNR